MKYKFYWKRWLLWNKLEVVGHRLENDTMILFKEDGGLETIPQWSKCKMQLKADWALAVKKNAEKETGVDLKTNF